MEAGVRTCPPVLRHLLLSELGLWCGGGIGSGAFGIALVVMVLENWGIVEGYGTYFVSSGGLKMRGDVCVVSKDGSPEIQCKKYS